jgi:hypothetical protein
MAANLPDLTDRKHALLDRLVKEEFDEKYGPVPELDLEQAATLLSIIVSTSISSYRNLNPYRELNNYLTSVASCRELLLDSMVDQTSPLLKALQRAHTVGKYDGVRRLRK